MSTGSNVCINHAHVSLIIMLYPVMTKKVGNKLFHHVSANDIEVNSFATNMQCSSCRIYELKDWRILL